MDYKLVLSKLLSLNSIEQNEILNCILNILRPKYFINSLKCPYCNNTTIIKNGKNKDTQRYLCKKCHKSFILHTNTPIYYSKKQHLLLLEFLKCLINQFSIRKTAKILNISNTTSFIWRHKILDFLNSCNNPSILSGTIQCKSLFFNENLKGNHKKNIKSLESSIELLNYRKVPIITALDDKNNILINPIRRNIKSFTDSINTYSANCDTSVNQNNYKHNSFLTVNDYKSKNGIDISHYSKNILNNILRRNNCRITEIDLLDSFVGKITKYSSVITNNIPHISSYNTFISHLSLKNASNILDDTTYKLYNLNKINNLTSKIYSFFKTYRGVATKYLNNYFSLFKIMHASL